MDLERRKITTYIYVQGESSKALLSERGLAQHFNVKRSYIREILLTLEGEGILERLPKRGYRFIKCSHEDWASIYPIRYAVEHEALRKTIERATAANLKALEKILQQMKDAAENKDLDGYFQADKNFHTSIVQFSQVKILIKIFATLAVTVFSSDHNRNNSFLLEQSQDAHSRLLQAIKDRNWPEAEAVLHAHIGGNTPI